MDLDKVEICKSLIEWFKTLNVQNSHSSAEEISDGVALAQALNQFAPESFTDIWLSKIKCDVNANWRLKMSNIKKVIEGLYDYYSDVLNYSLSNFPKPDAMKIAEKCDMVNLELLLELILGCAVNCADKQNYIKQIMCLEESLQQNIMKALQELESTWQGNSIPRNSMSVNFDHKRLQEERDVLEQKCFEAQKQINILEEEKHILQQELLKIQNDSERDSTPTAIGDDGVSIGPVHLGSSRYNELRRQLEQLKEELVQSETAREDLRIKTEQQQRDVTLLKQRIDELTESTIELSQLKDEIDVLRESNDKLKLYETQLITYKKKLEDYNDLKKQLKLAEERCADYMHRNNQYEEDAKKYSTLKGQVELFKNEIEDLHLKLDEELSKNIKLEFKNKNLENNIDALQRTKDSLIKERVNLLETIDEIKCFQSDNVVNTMSKELAPTVLLEKIRRLEHENKLLSEGQGGQAALMQLLNDANKRNDNLREQLKCANEQILSLAHTPKSDDVNLKERTYGKQLEKLVKLNDGKVLQLEEITQNSVLQEKITMLENTLATREQELLSFEVKYKKCIEKAKDVLKSLDPRVVADSTLNKISLKGGYANSSEKIEIEEQLITTAFYRHGIKMQRDAVDTKLAILMGQGQTFLSRQRISVPRKSFILFKSK